MEATQESEDEADTFEYAAESESFPEDPDAYRSSTPFVKPKYYDIRVMECPAIFKHPARIVAIQADLEKAQEERERNAGGKQVNFEGLHD